MNEDGGQKIFDFLMEMIRLKEQMQTDANYSLTSREHYIREYCTIRLNAGRQVGHTTAIMKLIEHYSLQKKKILVLSPTIEATKQLQRKMKIIGSEMEKYISFESCSDSTRLIGYQADLVIFDMFSVSSFAKGSKELIEKVSFVSAFNDKNFIIVLLG